MVAVAVAVVPTPTPIDLGAENLTSSEDTVYPAPTLLVVIALIVPAADTVAVNSAPTGAI